MLSARMGTRDDHERMLPERFRRHAAALERWGRSPLYVTLMRAAARDIESGGAVAGLFEGIRVPPESVPALRLLAALHHLVLSGRATQLAPFYPSVGGRRPPEQVWPSALAALEENAAWVRGRLARTVQTNDPGRAAALYAALLWLTDRYGLPLRLLELGASAGLNLLVDRFCYLVGDAELGDRSSPVRIADPWTRPPQLDLESAARRLRVWERSGCDVAPLDVSDTEDRLTLMSYIWPDEPQRLERTRAALRLAADRPPPVAAASAEPWLRGALARPGGEAGVTVIWHSLFRQYVDDAEWQALQALYAEHSSRQERLVWLCMEPGGDHLGMELTVRQAPDRTELLLARCGDHGPPIEWQWRRARAASPW